MIISNEHKEIIITALNDYSKWYEDATDDFGIEINSKIKNALKEIENEQSNS